MRRYGLYLALGLLSITSAATADAVTSAIQGLVAQHLSNAEVTIGRTRSEYVDARISVGMTCKNLNDEGTAVFCWLPGGFVFETGRFGPKDRVASYSTDFTDERSCSAARGYLVSRYGRALHSEESSGSDLFYWRYPKRKKRVIIYQEWPVEEEPQPYGPPRMKQTCHVAYQVGELVPN